MKKSLISSNKISLLTERRIRTSTRKIKKISFCITSPVNIFQKKKKNKIKLVAVVERR